MSDRKINVELDGTGFMVWLTVLSCIVLFWGDPDIHDAIMAWIKTCR